jgi:hypothetical protein
LKPVQGGEFGGREALGCGGAVLDSGLEHADRRARAHLGADGAQGAEAAVGVDVAVELDPVDLDGDLGLILALEDQVVAERVPRRPSAVAASSARWIPPRLIWQRVSSPSLCWMTWSWVKTLAAARRAKRASTSPQTSLRASSSA